MPSPSVAWSALALVGGLFLPSQVKWKPLFDYTNLQPSNAEYWAPLQQAQVPMEKAIEVAKETEKGTVRTLRAELKPGPEGAVWMLELYVGEEPEGPKRVNLTVSTAEPKVLRRLELRSLPPDEHELWTMLAKTLVPAEDSIEVAKKAAIGNKPQPVVIDPRIRTLRLQVENGAALWDIELMALDRKEDHSRRYNIAVDTQAPRFKHVVLLDRFPGTPLRRFEPTILPDGLVVYDWRPGEGDPITADAKVKVHYRLWLLDNTKIHDTLKSKLPETFQVSEAPLKGMTAGLLGMKVGGKRKICIPYSLAFGAAANEIAPPKAMVVCDIEILERLTQ
jgi:peptidylprolyl isomerase